jgi:hypothetical protein
MNDDDVELSLDEREALENVKDNAVPPQHIERALVDALRHQGLIGAPRRLWLLPTVAAAAVIVGIAAGMWGSRGLGDRPSSAARYVLLLYAGDQGEASPDRREEYARWARTVSAQGTAVSGNELAGDAEEITIAPPPQPYSNPTPLLGYFVIGARDLAEARRIAATCPHLRHGGRIVLRRVAS